MTDRILEAIQSGASGDDLAALPLPESTDFPHNESDWPHSAAVIDRTFAGVPAAERERMLWRNWAELFGLALAP